MLITAFKQAWKVVILVVGSTIVLLGIVMIVAPGPALVVIPLGLVVLATEFVWARRLLRRFEKEIKAAKEKLFSKRKTAKKK
jgi:tellurite resistance protein TerC